MSVPIVILGNTVLWPTTGDVNYSAGTTQFVTLVASALSPIAGLYNTTTGHVGNLALDNSDNLTLNGTPIASGTVSSIAITTSNGIGVTGSPITTSGTFHLSLGAITPSSVTTSGAVAATGTVTGSNLSGTNTGDQLITLTGDVTGTGYNTFATFLGTSGVTAGSYPMANIVVDAKGRVTSAANGGVNPNLSGTITFASSSVITGDFNALNRPHVISNTGNQSHWEVWGPNTSSSSIGSLYARSSSDVNNGAVLTLQAINNGVSTGSVRHRFLWTDIIGGTATDPVESLYFTLGASGTDVATLNPTGPANSTDLITKSFADAHYAASGGSSVTSFNTRTGAVTLSSGDVSGALGFTPYNAANPAGYITGNQTITLSGDATGSGTTSIALTLANSGVTAGSYTNANITVDAQGRVTAAANGSGGGAVWGAITGTLSSQSDLNTALGLKANAASPSLSGTITLANATLIEGDFSTFANRPRVMSNTGNSTIFEAIGPNTSTSAVGAFICRSSSDTANGNVVEVSAGGPTLNQTNGGILWGARIAGVNVDPTSANLFRFRGLASGAPYADINPSGPSNALDLTTLQSVQSGQFAWPLQRFAYTFTSGPALDIEGFVNVDPTSTLDLVTNVGIQNYQPGVSGGSLISFAQTRLSGVYNNQIYVNQVDASNAQVAMTTPFTLQMSDGYGFLEWQFVTPSVTLQGSGGALGATAPYGQVQITPANIGLTTPQVAFGDLTPATWFTSNTTSTTINKGQLVHASYSKTALPAGIVGADIYVPDATSLGRTGARCWFDGTNWIDFATNAAVV